jgi:membrane-associated phospholipid phosphatase
VARVARALARLDREGVRWARTAGHSPGVERAVGSFSRMGEHGAIWLAIGAAGALRDVPQRRAWRRATAVVAGAYLLNTAFKLAIRRQRPDLPGLPPLVATPTRLSFPSAHATTSFAGARAFSDLGAPRVALHALAVGLAVSRLYLGLHYPSDTVAGAVLGRMAARLAR